MEEKPLIWILSCPWRHLVLGTKGHSFGRIRESYIQKYTEQLMTKGPSLNMAVHFLPPAENQRLSLEKKKRNVVPRETRQGEQQTWDKNKKI